MVIVVVDCYHTRTTSQPDYSTGRIIPHISPALPVACIISCPDVTPPAVVYATDVLIVGSGVAGLSLALRLADSAKVTVLAKADLTQGSSLYAQGGVAAVLNDADSFGAHIQDTLQAGGGLCHPDTVEYTVQRGPAAIRWLIDQGVGFTRELGPDGRPHYHLTREGGHSHRRVIHTADATGKAMETTLAGRVRGPPEHHPAGKPHRRGPDHAPQARP